MRRVLIATLGCRLNQSESEVLAALYKAAGWEVVTRVITSHSDADESVALAIINTCAVTQKAEQKARRDIRLILEKCPNARVAVTGCYASLSRAAIEAIDERVEVVLKADIGEWVQGKRHNSGVCDEQCTNFSYYTSTFLAHSRASLKVQDGCNGNCAFCTIHIARGASVSLNAREASRRAKEMEDAGYHEVCLTGVNLGEWRCGEHGLPYLLRALLNGTQKVRFRLSSLHPDAVDDELLEAVQNPRVCAHFHLSVQSGSSKVLRAMNRGYTAEDVLRAVQRLRAHKYEPFIACDVIAGFPGESEADAAATEELCRVARFAHIHVFPFSPRPHTAAYNMRPYVRQEVVYRRVKVLEEMSAIGEAEYARSCIGRVYDAVAEERQVATVEDDKTDEGAFRAVTDNFLHVIVRGAGGIKAGDAIKVRITGVGQASVDVCN